MIQYRHVARRSARWAVTCERSRVTCGMGGVYDSESNAMCLKRLRGMYNKKGNNGGRGLSTSTSSSLPKATLRSRAKKLEDAGAKMGLLNDGVTKGIIDVNDDESSEKNNKRGMDTFRRIGELSRPEWKLIVLSCLTLGITSSTTLLLPSISGDVIDMAILASTDPQSNDTFSPFLTAAGLFSLTAAAGGGVYIRSLLLTKAGNQIVARIRSRLFHSLLTQDTAYFDRTKTGDALNRLTADAQLIQGAVTTQAVAVLRATVMSAGSTAMLFHTSPTLALVSLATLPPVFLAARVVGRRLRERHGEVQRLHADAAARAEETLAGVRTVKQFVGEPYELGRYVGAVRKAHGRAIEAGGTQAFFDSAVFVGSNGAVLCVMGYGGGMVLDGAMSAGALTGFLMYSLLLAGNVGSFSSTYAEMMKAVAAADRVFEVMDTQPSIPSSLQPVGDYDDYDVDHAESTHANHLSNCSIDTSSRPLSVEFSDATFAYPSRPDNIILGPAFSLKIHPGEVMAVVGGSGSGKSTIAALLTRLYDTQPSNHAEYAPSILIDGQDITALSPAKLRTCIGIVSQEPLLFDGTIEDNIRYGRRAASDEEVREAARIAHVLEFTDNMKDGLKTQVGTRGVQLSGGQKQRVAIARLCVKDPPIAIFDEATSALDAESEHHVKQAVDSVMKGRTVISIAHRLSTIRGADRIAVIHDGLVAEVGTFDELVAKGEDNGVFCSLMKRQLLST